MKNRELADVHRILVYKRTHNGDPNEDGVFGCNDCMRTVRDRDFDAVIGIGGITAEKYKINGKINWIGINPKETDEEEAARRARRRGKSDCKSKVNGKKQSDARMVVFDHFLAFWECGYFPPECNHPQMFGNSPKGPLLKKWPKLAKALLRDVRAPRMLDKNCRDEFSEALEILKLARGAPPSPTASAFATPIRIAGREPKVRVDQGGHRC